MKVFMFPGQGSQKRGMGQDLFDAVPEFTAVESEIDALIGYSVRQMCLEDPGNRLQLTQHTQPCLYIVNALHYFKALAKGERPDIAIGHSLGEYNALLAAGAFDLLDGLRIVTKRGELMSRERDGGMAAVIGLAPETILESLHRNGLQDVDVANFNSPTQTVISGPVAGVDRAAAVLQEAGAGMCIPLAVSAAFHSRHMERAAAAFEDFLDGMKFRPLHIPVIANVTGQPYPGGLPSATVRSLLVRQIASPVLWTQSVHTILQWGEAEFCEVGPGNVLTRLLQQIRQSDLVHAA
jgi:malonyl CoA-acyl carrier protein transacylase